MKPVKNIIYNKIVCGLFKLTDLFELKNGTGNTIYKEGEYPQISASAKNNGHSGLSNNPKYKNSFTIAKDGMPGVCFWHPYKFDTTSPVIIAIPKFNTNNAISVVISAYITSYLKPRFNYGKKFAMKRAKKQLIPLPITKDEEIDFESMEKEGLELINKKIQNAEKLLLVEPIVYSKINNSIKEIVYNRIACGLFKLEDLFELKNGTGNISKEGRYPQVTASLINNGHSGLSDNPKFKNSFTIVKDGDPGCCLWHPYEFDTNSHVLIAKPKFNTNNALSVVIAGYITSYLRPRFNYGKAFAMKRAKKQLIPLPVTKEGDIDFESMEKEGRALINEKINRIINNFKD